MPTEEKDKSLDSKSPKKKKSIFSGSEDAVDDSLYQNSRTRSRVLSKAAAEIKRYMLLRKMASAALAALVLLSTITYVVSVLYKRTGSFSISLDKFDHNRYALSLSDTIDFSNATSQLNADIDQFTTNISVKSLPPDLDTGYDGNHSGDNYIAYSFYLKNRGETTVAYEYAVYFTNATNNLEDAIRVRLYVNGVQETFAKAKTDGTGPEEGTTRFMTNEIITRGKKYNFAPDEMAKFTIVIWIEGDDPDCTDALLGGTLKIEMSLEASEN